MSPPERVLCVAGVSPWSTAETAAREKEVLGFYLTEHPLAAIAGELRYLTSGDLSHCLAKDDGAEVRVAGIVTAIKKSPDRKGQTMAFVTLEDEFSEVECIVFSDLLASKNRLLETDQRVWLRARVSRREGEGGKLVASDLRSWDEARDMSFGLHLEIEPGGIDAGVSDRLDALLSSHSGGTPVYLHVLEEGGQRTILLSRKYRVAASDDITYALSEVLGPGRARWAPRL